MKSFKEFLLEEGKDKSTNKVDAMETLVDGLKKSLENYSLGTRNYVWDKINSSKGKNLMEKILRNPKIKISEGEIRKLATNK